MGHIVNPITYRLSKSKFWKSAWINLTKKNYQKYFFEDYNLDKIISWFLRYGLWNKYRLCIFDYKYQKLFTGLLINIFIIERSEAWEISKPFRDIFKKQYQPLFFLKILFKNSLLKSMRRPEAHLSLAKFRMRRFFGGIIYNKYRVFPTKFYELLRFKNNSDNLQKKYYFFIYKYFLNDTPWVYRMRFGLYWSLNYILFLKKIYKKRKFRRFKRMTDKRIKRLKNIQDVLRLYSDFFRLFFNKIFFFKKYKIRFIKKREFNQHSHYLKELIKMRIRQHYRISHFMGLLFRRLCNTKTVVGVKMGFYGRYQRRLRNRKRWFSRGKLSTSNINAPISYHNFVLILKYGICGIKIYLVVKTRMNELF